MTSPRLTIAFALLLVSCIIGGFSSADSAPATPMETIRAAVKDAKAALDDRALLPFEKKTRIREIIIPQFDTREMAKRVLGIHWPKYKDRADEFIPLFVALLEKAYLNFSTLEAAKGMDTTFLSERVDGDFAEVFTKVVTKNGTPLPIAYRLLRTAQGWKVYDIVIENISMISSYRTQFNKIITTSSFDELLKKLKQKVEEKEDRQK